MALVFGGGCSSRRHICLISGWQAWALSHEGKAAHIDQLPDALTLFY